MNYSASTFMMISLPDLQLLEITGADAVAFAHAQFSTDVRSLQTGAWQWSTWLSPQGRVRAFFQLLRADEQRLHLLLRGGAAETLCASLAPYVLRARVALRASDARVLGTYRPLAHALAVPGSPLRWLTTTDTQIDADVSAESRERWRLADIRAGLPVLAENLLEQLLPQWLGLERLGAVSVAKGCYPGQEVMSRLHFKGGNKRSLYRLELTAADLPVPGTALFSRGGETAGQIVMAAQRDDQRFEALASLVGAAADATLGGATPEIADVGVLQRFA